METKRLLQEEVSVLERDLRHLPEDILVEIFTQVDLPQRASVALTCKVNTIKNFQFLYSQLAME